MKKAINYFTKFEWTLWSISILCIIFSFIFFGQESYLELVASLIGATSLIFCAKGNPFGNALMIVFCILYAIISYSFRYYGELLTYAGMSLPMAVFSLISWLRHPFDGKKSEVTVNTLTKKDIIQMIFFTVLVTIVFYFILKYLNNANIIPSTLSVTTSFAAVFLCYKRSPYFALVYAANDIVLIILWVMAAITDISYLSVIICFIVFLVNDLYGFFNWKKMQKNQQA
ncbi:MAG: nicotinamide mononucleotide transporter [Clostridia bacterium]|nr:nicotinamide mononucleotide transporter [Clostridia bacterium]